MGKRVIPTSTKGSGNIKISAEGGIPEIRKPFYPSQIITNLILHIFLIAIIGIIAYSNTFDVPFAFDDVSNITENPVIKDLDNFLSFSKGYDFNPRRFVGYLTFAMNYHFGGLNVTGYHIVNLVIHILNSILVYFLVRLTFNTPFCSSQLSAISSHNPHSSPLNLRGDRGGTIHPSVLRPSFRSPSHTDTGSDIYSAEVHITCNHVLFTIPCYVHKGKTRSEHRRQNTEHRQ